MNYWTNKNGLNFAKFRTNALKKDMAITKKEHIKKPKAYTEQ